MGEEQDHVRRILDRLSDLIKRQDSFQKEIEDLRREIRNLELQEIKPGPLTTSQVEPVIREVQKQQSVRETPPFKEKAVLEETEAESAAAEIKKSQKVRLNLEKFIGENLINKVGIIILVIGVGIGVKYAIDHDLISPLTRIILGYLLGLGLLGFAFRLRKQYRNFSAVLLSGSMAILYFITFVAYSFYALIPLAMTFALMAMFTVYTVFEAIRYNRQIIAHFGLVGAYAVPFLLGGAPERVLVLFIYIAIINAGILVIAFRKYWKPLYYSSFLLTWLIFITWFIPSYDTSIHFYLAWTFMTLFFAIFYLISLAYKLIKKEKFVVEDILLILANSSVFFGLGYAVLHQHIKGEDFKGLFTLCNALIHFLVALIISRQKQYDKNLYYFTIGLAVAFFTIAIPVQLDGNWVTMLWATEAAVLFWIGRTKNTIAYELLSFPLMILAFFCITGGWPNTYHTNGPLQNGVQIFPIFNINFLTSIIFIASFGFINILNNSNKFPSPLQKEKILMKVLNFILPGMLLLVLYFSFYMEIATFWNQRYIDTMVIADRGMTPLQQIHNNDIPSLKTLSLLVYSLLFFSLLSFVNMRRLKKRLLGQINLGINIVVVGLFLTLGLFALGSLRESYLSQEFHEYFYRGVMNIGIRYVSFLFVGLILFAEYHYVRQEFLDTDFHMEFDLLLHISLLTIASNELINWMDLSGSQASYKLGLSILFGVYSLLVIILGIWKKKLHLRIGAIVLFAATLLKLFFYDLTYLDTISKTIVFVVLGLLLLIISFLYNKYKKVIFEDRHE